MLGIIGGSGIYEIEGLDNARWTAVESPFGAPSDEILTGALEGHPVAFLPRHGRGHVLNPSEVNYRANIDALKRLGVTDILSVSACGSLKEALAPGHFVLVDQFIDRTRGRPKTFFEDGVVAHVSLAEPTCGRLREICADALDRLEIPNHVGGTYLAMEGPQFSTRAESALYRSWGADVIGMTNMPEAALAREAEICYQSVACVTDYDCWHPEHGAVEVSHIIAVLMANAVSAKALVRAVAHAVAKGRPAPCGEGCDRALEHALITAPSKRNSQTLQRLGAVAGRVLKG